MSKQPAHDAIRKGDAVTYYGAPAMVVDLDDRDRALVRWAKPGPGIDGKIVRESWVGIERLARPARRLS